MPVTVERKECQAPGTLPGYPALQVPRVWLDHPDRQEASLMCLLLELTDLQGLRGHRASLDLQDKTALLVLLELLVLFSFKAEV